MLISELLFAYFSAVARSLHVRYRVDEKAFRQMQQSQKLMIEFADYPHVLMKMLNSCIREPQRYAYYVTQHLSWGLLLQFRVSVQTPLCPFLPTVVSAVCFYTWIKGKEQETASLYIARVNECS